MNQSEAEQKLREGQHAERILKDTLVKSAIDGMRETVYENIRTSHFKNVDEREDLYKMLRTIDAFEQQFQTRIRDGKKAKSILERLLKR